jgi:hypothetical protein
MPNKIQTGDKNVIMIGLAIFVLIVLFPFWYNHGKAAPAPEVVYTEKAKAAKECVRDKAYMKSEHMQLLDVWRDTVVRDATRKYINSKGREFEMSLSNTCLDCHSNKAEFCDRCHNYASVKPYCWDCHIDNPKEKK